MVLAIALLLLTSFLSNSLLAAIVEILNNIVPGSGFWWRILSFLASFGVTTTIFALMYTLLPDVEIPWRDTFVGAITTAVLFLIGQFLFGLFLSNTDFGSAYGVAGSFVIVITWIFFAAQILLLGAEFTRVYGKQRGSPIVPSEYAIAVDRAEGRKSSTSRQNRHQR
jgi:membrane protein